jgi:arachidonate 15-lipoxygenase
LNFEKAKTMTTVQPTIPQDPSNDPAAIVKRQFEVRTARTIYNYMFSYLEPLPVSADVPPGENFTADYLSRTADSMGVIVANIVAVVKELVGKEIRGSIPPAFYASVEKFEAMRHALSQKSAHHGLATEAKDLEGLVQGLCGVIENLKGAIEGALHIPIDIADALRGIEVSLQKTGQTNFTEIMKYPLFEVLNPSTRREYLTPTSVSEYEKLYKTLPLPFCLTIPDLPWMKLPEGQKPWQQDWFFGYEQIAGFNTTMLQGVTSPTSKRTSGVELQTLLAKFPVTDGILQTAAGDSTVTLESAARDGLLYVCDYSMLEGVPSGVAFGQLRHHAAPIALFYWNRNPPPGYPPINEETRGALQPIAIQLGQKPDPELTPIFVPSDGNAWQIAKFFVQNACLLEHETVAHLGGTHLIIEPMVVAMHRQLPPDHPIYVLLLPHFRFTIAINDSALNSLIVPGGVISSAFSPTLDGSLDVLRNAHLAWRFDEQMPSRLFRERGVGAENLPNFPFRDDTLLIWEAICSFVGHYLRLYYRSDADVIADFELQAWVNEMVSPRYASVRGMDGLVNVGKAENPHYRIESLDYLTQVLAQIIYIAAPLHASVNFAQYPLMAYAPSAASAVYHEPPRKTDSSENPVAYMPPFDVALYWTSFTYLMTAMQYDTLGVYGSNLLEPYFVDARAEDLSANFRGALAAVELEIRRRNRSRPLPYLFQLPSMIPNSISS